MRQITKTGMKTEDITHYLIEIKIKGILIIHNPVKLNNLMKWTNI